MGKYYVMAENGVGGRALEWAMRLFGYGNDFAAATADADGDRVSVQKACSSSRGCSGRSRRNRTTTSAVLSSGLSLPHDRRHMVRAVMEGVALNLAWLRPAVESFVGNEFASLRFGGGGAESDLWAQMLADALDRPIHQLKEPRATNARGAAFLAFATLGMLSIADVPSLLHTRAVPRTGSDQPKWDGRGVATPGRAPPTLANLSNS